MVVGRILSPVHSLGPGERICIWTQGCSKKCYGCISPELQSKEGNEIDEAVLAVMLEKIAQKGNCTGLTISGGDPFEQSDSLLKLLKLVKKMFDDILVYTGYTLQAVLRGEAGDAGIECLNYIDVLIDGPYVKELNKSDCVLRGSSNQIIQFLNREIEEKYVDYMKKGRILENFVHGNKTIITGILNEVD